MKILFCVSIISVLALFVYPALADDRPRTTEEVLKAHHDNVLSGDIEAVLNDYTDSAVIILPTGRIEGKDALRKFFEERFPEYVSPDFSYTITTSHVGGDVAFIVWTGESADRIYDHVADTMVVRDGKIVTQAACARVRPKTAGQQ
ncbi:MAG: nuclear transport factor 2 family protein [Gammaproteobacteria bacterium]|nr:nuclear transport factor 2 family protein [Gammaproteobacteria bacterium]